MSDMISRADVVAVLSAANGTSQKTLDAIRALTAERDALAARLAEVEAERDDAMALFHAGEKTRRAAEAAVYYLTRAEKAKAALNPEALAAMVGARVASVLNDFNSADWYWRVMDPDDNSDNPAECIHRGYIGKFTVCEIGSSFRGPTRYGFNAPCLDPDSDDEEFLHFATQQEAIDAANERRAALALIEKDASHDRT